MKNESEGNAWGVAEAPRDMKTCSRMRNHEQKVRVCGDPYRKSVFGLDNIVIVLEWVLPQDLSF